jgi:hypothetical protein
MFDNPFISVGSGFAAEVEIVHVVELGVPVELTMEGNNPGDMAGTRGASMLFRGDLLGFSRSGVPRRRPAMAYTICTRERN